MPLNQYDTIRCTHTVQHEVDQLEKQLWYGRHQVAANAIQDGTTIVVAQIDDNRSDGKGQVLETVWTSACASAARIEAEVGVDKLGSFSDHEWGKINGKLSALRWVQGYQWDMLDT